MEDDPKNFSVPAPGGFFFAGWIVAIIVVLIATAGLVLARELWIGRQTSALESENEAGPHVLVSQVSQAPPRAISSCRRRFAASTRPTFTPKSPAI